MQSIGSWVLFGLVISAATAMLGYMLWQVGRHRAIETAKVWWLVVQLVLSVAMAVGAAATGRALLGTTVGDLPRPGEGAFRIELRPLDRQQQFILAGAVAVMLGCFLWALRTVNVVMHAPPLAEPPQSDADG
ncbi:MAG: hypothetical protein N2512_15135 [Armatimonadetes bacterium]|nr:hypothetical protein [Armatimonadota bacterium]